MKNSLTTFYDRIPSRLETAQCHFLSLHKPLYSAVHKDSLEADSFSASLKSHHILIYQSVHHRINKILPHVHTGRPFCIPNKHVNKEESQLAFQIQLLSISNNQLHVSAIYRVFHDLWTLLKEVIF